VASAGDADAAGEAEGAAVALDAGGAPDPCVDADEHAASRRTGPITA
jgi:hypothetical protein